MNKTLYTLWIIIIIGIIFIGIKLYSPSPNIETTIPHPPEEIITTQEGTPEEITIIEEEISPLTEIEEKKTYADYINEGDEAIANGYIQLAISNYYQAATINPNSTIPLIKLAKAYLTNNDPENAKKAYEKAEEIDPSSIEIKLGIARSFLNLRNIEEAKNLVWTLDPNNQYVKYYTGIILILYKDYEGSKQIFNELSSSEIVDPYIRDNSQIFADAYSYHSSFRESETIFLQTLLAKALTEVGEYNAAIPLLYDVINEKNNYRDAWIVLGYAYLNTEQIPDAIDSFDQAKSLDEEKPETLFFLGLAYFANNEIDKAIHYIELADKNGYEPKDDIKLKLGDLYIIQEEYEKAEKKYDEVLSINTNSLDVFIRAIWLNIDKLNNTKKAMELSEQAMELYPEESMSYNLMGWTLTANGDYDEAKKYLTKALDMNPDFDAANLNLGWLYEKKGLTILAKEYYKKAYILGNGNSIANLAAKRFNDLTEKELKKYYQQVNISAP